MKGLFLGAGASCELGMPLVWELTRELKHHMTPARLRQINDQAKLKGHAQPQHVLDDFLSVMARDDMHYESVLGYLEVQNTRHGGREPAYHGLHSWFVEHVYKALYLRHKKRLLQILVGLRYLDGIAGLAQANKPLWIFTTNHDVILDCLGATFKLPVSYGFPGRMTLPLRDQHGEISGELKAQTLTKDDMANSRLQFASFGEPGLNIIKVHGGLDLFTLNNTGEDVLRLLPLDDMPGGPILSLIAADEQLYYPAARAVGEHVTNEIAYADERGEMQLLRRSILAGAYKFDERHPQVLPAIFLPMFKGYLNYVRHLICIGYGFGDVHINLTLRGWLDFSKERQLEIVGPGASVPSSLAHLGPQITTVDATATDYLEQFSPKPLTAEERALKAGLASYHDSLSKDFR